MANFTESLYYKFPYIGQNLAISLYGAKSYFDRFGGRTPEPYRSSPILLSAPDAHRIDLQHNRLRTLIDHAIRCVPHYQNRYKDIDTSDMTPSKLAEIFPVLEKKDIKHSNGQFFSSCLPTTKTSLLHTSGSTGTPLSIKATKESRRIVFDQYQKILSHFCCSYRDRSTTFAGRVLYKGNNHSRPGRYDYFNRTQYLSSYGLSSSTIQSYIRTLNRWSPRFIDTYPSAIIALVRLARERNLSPKFQPEFILTSSETLSNSCRYEIERFFKAPVVNHYGSTEMAAFAIDVGGSFYFDPLYSVIELHPVGGGIYKVIATGLSNLATPLIRYDTGDCVFTNNPENPYAAESIVGRLDDFIVTPEGRYVGRMDPVFKGLPGIKESQIVQTQSRQIVVKVVIDPHSYFNPDELILRIQERTSDLINIKVEKVARIPPGPNGKVRHVISNVNQKNHD